jgi:hypothetical protein
MSALGSSTSGAARVIETLRTSTRWLRFTVIAVLLTGAVAGCSSGGGVSPSTGASSAPTSAAAPQLLPGAGHTPVAIPAGTYAVVVHGTTSPAPMPVIRVPAGYSGAGFAVHTMDQGTTVAPDAHGLSFWEVQSVMSDPCKAGKHGVDPGPTVADLARALAAQPLRAGSDPVPVTVAGYHGLYVETSVPAHIDFSTCQDGYFDTWIGTGDHGHYAFGPGQRDSLWILDVGGYRLVIDGWHMPGATRAQIDEITGMVKTLTFGATS